MLKQESGQALLIVLAILLLGGAFIVPAVAYANSALIGQRLAKNSLVDVYTADACNTYVMWNLLYTAGFADSPPPSVTCTLNGITSTVNINKLTASNLVDQTIATTVNYAMSANHQLWLIISTNDTQGGGVYIAYDTANSASKTKVPWVTQGIKNYYMHNNPTPPTGNTNTPLIDPQVCNASGTCYDALRMDTTLPTVETLYNYDLNHDTYQGRWIEQSNDGAQCASKVSESQNVRIIWRSPTLAAADTINGPVEVRWWWAIADQSFGSHDLTLWICDFDTTRPVVITGQRNPVNILTGSGKLNTGKIPVWVDAFDLWAQARSAKITQRVDKVSATALRVRSWQWDKVPGQQ